MIDYFTVWHIVAAFVIGLLAGFFIKRFKRQLIFAIAVPALWEVIEQNILVSWMGLLEPEPLLNSFTDIGFGIAFIMVGFMVHRMIMRRKG